MTLTFKAKFFINTPAISHQMHTVQTYKYRCRVCTTC